MHPPAFYFVLIIAIIVGVCRYRLLIHAGLIWAIPYLLMNFIAETYGIFVKESDYWIYNIATFLEFIFYFFIFYRALSGSGMRKIILWFSCLYFPFAIVNIVLIQGIHHFHTNSFLVGSVFLIFLAIAYLRQVIMNIEIINPLRQSMFWITTGVLFFYLGSFFYLGFFEYMQEFHSSLIPIFRQILNLLNVILYFFYIIAFNVRSKH